jgi:hypothetical protein
MLLFRPPPGAGVDHAVLVLAVLTPVVLALAV